MKMRVSLSFLNDSQEVLSYFDINSYNSKKTLIYNSLLNYILGIMK